MGISCISDSRLEISESDFYISGIIKGIDNEGNIINISTGEEPESNNYEKFDINKDYYLACPDCNKVNNNYFIQKIESVNYISEEKDFKLVYKCFCEQNDINKKEKYLYELIIEMQKCDERNEDLIFFCYNCNTKYCLSCKKNNNHKAHQINKIINEDIISYEIMFQISEQKIILKDFIFLKKYLN